MRLVALRLAQAEVRDRAAALRLQRLDLPLRQREGCSRTLRCSLLLTQLRGVPLGVLNGARESRRRQLLVARRLLLSKHQRRLRLVDLCLIGMDLGLLHNDLRVDILDVGPRGGDLSLGLGKRIAVIAVVDPRDHLAGDDVLVVGDRDRRQVTGHFGGDGELTRGDEGVVRRLEMRGVVPIDIARRQSHKEEDQAAEERKRAPPQYAPAGLVAARCHHRARHADLRVRRQRLNLGSTGRTIGGVGARSWTQSLLASPNGRRSPARSRDAHRVDCGCGRLSTDCRCRSSVSNVIARLCRSERHPLRCAENGALR